MPGGLVYLMGVPSESDGMEVMKGAFTDTYPSVVAELVYIVPFLVVFLWYFFLEEDFIESFVGSGSIAVLVYLLEVVHVRRIAALMKKMEENKPDEDKSKPDKDKQTSKPDEKPAKSFKRSLKGMVTLGLMTWNMAGISDSNFEFWSDDPNLKPINKLMHQIVDVPSSGIYKAANEEKGKTENLQQILGTHVEELKGRLVEVFGESEDGAIAKVFSKKKSLTVQPIKKEGDEKSEDFSLGWNALKVMTAAEFMKKEQHGFFRLVSLPNRNLKERNVKERSAYFPDAKNWPDLDGWIKDWFKAVFGKDKGADYKVDEIEKLKFNDLQNRYFDEGGYKLSDEIKGLSNILQYLYVFVWDAIVLHFFNTIREKNNDENVNFYKINERLKKVETKWDNYEKGLKNYALNGKSHIVCLQEVTDGLIGRIKDLLGGDEFKNKWEMEKPSELSINDQNSIILYRTSELDGCEESKEILEKVKVKQDEYNAKKPKKEVTVANGDLMVLKCTLVKSKIDVVVSSFHGSSGGGEAKHVVKWVGAAAEEMGVELIISGLDANEKDDNLPKVLGAWRKQGFQNSTGLVKQVGKDAFFTKGGYIVTTAKRRTRFNAQQHKGQSWEENFKREHMEEQPKDLFVVKHVGDESLDVFLYPHNVERTVDPKKKPDSLLLPNGSMPSDHYPVFSILEIYKKEEKKE